jgi:uncharacterized protein YbcV (DUF1398 family)
MDTKIIFETARATLAGTMSFPEVVKQLIATDVEYYHVDYVGMRKTFYSAEGNTVISPIMYEGLPPVATYFDAAALRAAILDSQRNNQTYRDFSRRVMQAGVQSYFAFFRGKRVTYLARNGEQHIEWFPGAGQILPEAIPKSSEKALQFKGSLAPHAGCVAIFRGLRKPILNRLYR